MPHSLRAKLSGLRYKGILEDKDYKRLCKALDNEDVLEQIREEIDQIMAESGKAIRPFDGMEVVIYTKGFQDGIGSAIDVIDKYKAESEKV